ncbi:TetR family transcriptional regulator [uncultured Parabacteroides sp.]|uniref:TetR/AcrR family transcriptional regulator n=1 Tax=uncultured Parabacteroides sp. TaxID=512312 RepID=UPI0025F05FC7|nr:TetR family transcriptional regulator [uncultured Parabacteroides sp.]
MEISVEEKIIDAAREVFFEKGYSGATMRDIASKAEVNLALLHYYYRTKEKIFDIVLNQAFVTLFKRLNKVFTSDVDIFRKIELMVESYIGVGIKHPQLPGFVIHELEVNKMLVHPLILKYKEEQNATKNLSVFYADVQNAIDNKIIKPIDIDSLFVDILSLSLFPFMAKNFLSGIVLDNKKYNHFIRERSKYVSSFIVDSIKV